MLKKVLYRVILFICLFACTCSIVVTVAYSNYKKQEDNQQSVQQETILSSLIGNITASDKISGNVSVTSSDGKTNLCGNVLYSNTDTICVNADINGVFNGLGLNLNITYLNDLLYISFEDTKVVTKVSDGVDAISQVFNSVTDNTLSGMLDVGALQSMLGNVTETQIDGGYRIDMQVENLCSICAITDNNYLPTALYINNFIVDNVLYNASVVFGKASFDTILVPNGNYTQLNLQNYTNIAGSVLNILKTGGVSFVGNLTLENNIDIPITVVIDKNLNLQASFNFLGVFVDIYYSNQQIYLSIFDNVFKVSISELYEFLKNNFNLKVDNEFDVQFLNGSELIFNKQNSIIFDIVDNNFKKVYINGANFTADLSVLLQTQYVSVPTSATNVTSYQLTSIINKYKRLVNANEFSINVDASVSGVKVDGKLYVNFSNKFSIINSFAYIGKIAGKKVEVYLNNNTYYISYDGVNAKINAKNVGELYALCKKVFGLEQIDLQQTFNEIFNKISNINIKTSGNANIVLNNGATLNVYARSYNFDVCINNFYFNNVAINGSASVYITADYACYLNNINLKTYTDYSNISDLANAGYNTLTKRSNQFAGNVSISLWDYNIYNISIKLNTYYTSGKLKFVINLYNLPTCVGLTEYSAILNKDNNATITIYDGYFSLYRTVTNRFTNKVSIEENYKIKLSDVSASVVKDILGLSNFVYNKIMAGSGVSVNSSAIKNLLNDGSIKLADNYLYINLINMRLSKYITKLDVNLAYNKSNLQSITFNLSLFNMLHISMYLN